MASQASQAPPDSGLERVERVKWYQNEIDILIEWLSFRDANVNVKVQEARSNGSGPRASLTTLHLAAECWKY